MSSARPDSAQRAAARARSGCGPRGCLGTLLIVAVGLVVVFGLEWATRIAFDPWSVPLGDRPTLTGEWVGTLRTASGMRFGLALRTDYRGRYGSSGSAGSSSGIEGNGQLCNRRGERYDYNLSGAVREWGGASSWLTMGSVDTGVGGSGWGFEVRWDGDRLTLGGVNDAFELDERPIGGRPHLITLDPLVGELRRTPFGELEAICRGLMAEGR